MMITKVENMPHLVRDNDTKAVLSTNIAAYHAHLKQREQLSKVDSLCERMDNIEQKLNLFISILNK